MNLKLALAHATEIGRRIIRQGALDQSAVSALYKDYRAALETGAAFTFTRFLVLRHQIDEGTCAWLEGQVPFLEEAQPELHDAQATVRLSKGVIDRLFSEHGPTDRQRSPKPAVSTLWFKSPPLPPVLVTPTRAVRIGRATDCELCLPHPGVSRTHAVAQGVDGTLVLDDRSTYGTFVNGVAITRHRLQPGDVVAIGPYVIEVDLSPPQASLDDTRKFRLPGLVGETGAWHGTLQSISVAEILQQVEAQQKTGELRLPGRGQIAFEAGRPVAAELGGLVGELAVFALLQLTAGEFSFVSRLEEREPNLSGATVTGLLLEASRRQDEGVGPY